MWNSCCYEIIGKANRIRLRGYKPRRAGLQTVIINYKSIFIYFSKWPDGTCGIVAALKLLAKPTE